MTKLFLAAAIALTCVSPPAYAVANNALAAKVNGAPVLWWNGKSYGTFKSLNDCLIAGHKLGAAAKDAHCDTKVQSFRVGGPANVQGGW
jgi:hypothetical protein